MNCMIVSLAPTAGLLFGALGVEAQTRAPSDPVTVESASSFPKTERRLVGALEAAGIKVAARGSCR